MYVKAKMLDNIHAASNINYSWSKFAIWSQKDLNRYKNLLVIN